MEETSRSEQVKYIPYTKISVYRKRNTPDKCPIFECNMSDAVLDHDHKTGMVRGVLHRQSNARGGKIENSWKRFGQNNAKVSLPQALINLAKYLKRGDTKFLHPVGLRQLVGRFVRSSKEDQIETLIELNIKKSEIKACINTEERSVLYRQTLIKNKYV